MIQYLNSRKSSAPIIIMVSLIVLPMAFLGVTSEFQSATPISNVAEVNGYEISALDLARAVRLRQQEIIEQLGESADPRYYEDEIIRPGVLGQLIRQKLFTSMLQDADVGYSDDEIKRDIIRFPQFQIEDKFSQDEYRSILASLGFTTQSYIKEVKEQYINQLFLRSLQGSSFNTEASLDYYIQLIGEKRNYTYLRLPIAGQVEKTTVSSDEINTYYQSNKEQYRVPELVTANYIEIDKQAVFPSISITTDAILQRYEAYKQEQSNTSYSEVAHILIESADDGSHQAKIDEVQAKINAGEDFSQLAGQYSDDFGSAVEGGNLGLSDGSVFPEAFQTAMAALEIGQVSAPVQTSNGFHFIKLINRQAGTLGSLDEERNRIVQELTDEALERRYSEVVETLKDRVYASNNLQEVVTSMQDILALEVKKTEPFSTNGGSGIMVNQAVVREAFTDEVFQQRLISNVVEINRGGSEEDKQAIAIQVESIAPSYLPELAEVSEQIETQLKTIKASEAIQQLADSLIEQLNSGDAIEDIAKKNELEWQAQIDATRNSYLEEDRIAFSMVHQSLPASESFSLDNGDILVLRLDSVNPGSRVDFTQEQLLSIDEQRVYSTANQELIAYQEYLLKSADIDSVIDYQ